MSARSISRSFKERLNSSKNDVEPVKEESLQENQSTAEDVEPTPEENDLDVIDLENNPEEDLEDEIIEPQEPVIEVLVHIV